jgi:hypothetical protein
MQQQQQQVTDSPSDREIQMQEQMARMQQQLEQQQRELEFTRKQSTYTGMGQKAVNDQQMHSPSFSDGFSIAASPTVVHSSPTHNTQTASRSQSMQMQMTSPQQQQQQQQQQQREQRGSWLGPVCT